MFDTMVETEASEISPYTAPVVLIIGQIRRQYTVPRAFLPSSLLKKTRALKNITLTDIDDDVAHTFVHFLYSGEYQTLKSPGLSTGDLAIKEHRRSLMAYSTAKKYRVENLASTAQEKLEANGIGVPISAALENMRSAFLDLHVEDTVLEQHLHQKIKEAIESDKSFLSSPLLSDQYQQGFERTLFKSVVKFGGKRESAPGKSSEDSITTSQIEWTQSKLRHSDLKGSQYEKPTLEEAETTHEQNVRSESCLPYEEHLNVSYLNARANVIDDDSLSEDQADSFVDIPTPKTEPGLEFSSSGENSNDERLPDAIFSQKKGFQTFPIQQRHGVVPACRQCQRICQTRKTVESNGYNFGRPYYICIDCPANGRNEWVAWDDDIGLCPSNPICRCGNPSRQDRVLRKSKHLGMGFWTCATGSCGYHSKFRSGKVDEEDENSLTDDGEFIPWLLEA